MPKAYSEDLRLRVVSAYRSGRGSRDVSEQYKVSIPCIYRWDKIERETGALRPLYKAGGHSLIHDDEKFLAFAETHAHSTLSQMADAWEDDVSIFTISRKLRKLGITRKKRPSAIKNDAKQAAKRS